MGNLMTPTKYNKKPATSINFISLPTLEKVILKSEKDNKYSLSWPLTQIKGVHFLADWHVEF